MTTKRLLGILATVALALTACSGEGSQTGSSRDDAAPTPGIHEGKTPDEVTRGGTLTFADMAESRSLDPTRTFSTGFSGGTALVAVYDQLMRWNEREQEFEPRLAQSVEPNEDHSVWTINLRSGVTFSDGTPLNADAVLGSFDYYFANQGLDLGVVAPLWVEATKVDDLTVQITLSDTWATFPFALGTGLGFIMAPAAIANGPDEFQPIGAGAFTFDVYRPAEELVLTANPEFWEGRPHLDALRFVWLGADDTRLDSFESGSVDVALIRNEKIIQQAWEDDTSGWITFENLGVLININAAEGRPGASLTVRQAIAHAIDAEELNDRVWDGKGMPTKHLFGPESHWYNPDAPVREYDLEKAKELLDQARSEGFDGTVRLLSPGDALAREQGLALQAQLEAAGFTVELDFARTRADLTTRIYVDRDYDFARSGLSTSDADPYGRLFEQYFSTAVTNTGSFNDPAMDDLLVELRTAQGEDRRDVLRRIEELYLDKVPGLSLASSATFLIWGDTVHGVQPTNEAMVGFEKAWIE